MVFLCCLAALREEFPVRPRRASRDKLKDRSMRHFMLIPIMLWSVLQPSAPGVVQAQNLSIQSTSVVYDFAQRMTFTAFVTGAAPLVQAVVFYQSGNQTPAAHTADAFAPARDITVTATIDLKTNSLTPFSTVSYWWEVKDQVGNTVRSATQTVSYVDNRFPWQETVSGQVRVHWYQGDSGYATAAANIAAEVLPRIQQQLGADSPAPIDIYLYATQDDLRSAVELAGREWLGGQARPELGVVLVAIPPGDEAQLQMRRDIPHELTHLMTFVATTPNYNHVPRWLDEGLATLNEGEPNSTQALAVQDALANQRLIPLETLCGAFPSDASQALLAYGQSRSVVQTIIDQYGSSGIQALLAAYRDGATCSGGVERGLNTTLAGLELQWRTLLQANTSTSAPIASTTAVSVVPWLILIAIIALPFIVLLLARKPDKLTTNH